MNTDTSKVFDQIMNAAEQVIGLKGLTPRDKNAAIGKLRDVAAFLRGAEGLADFKQAPYSGPVDEKPAPRGEKSAADKPAEGTSGTPIKK